MNAILALDCSGRTAGVCVLRGGVVCFERTLDEGLTHSETALPLVRDAFSQTGLDPAALSAYAVTAGPGSFTGLRIGIALVKGLALPFGTPCAGVSTLLALAACCGLAGTVVCALNARRGEVYWAAFDCRGAPRRLTEDAASHPREIAKANISCGGQIFLIGDGAEICYNVLRPQFDVTVAAGEPWPIARGAALAARLCEGGAQSAEALRPSYLRDSQAQRERAARMERAVKNEQP